MSVMELIEKGIGTYENKDPEWEQFVRDHLSYIKDNSVIYVPTATYIRPFQNNLTYYLKAVSCNLSIEWIVKLINGIVTDDDFENITTIHIPDTGIIKTLFETYQTIKNKK